MDSFSPLGSEDYVNYCPPPKLKRSIKADNVPSGSVCDLQDKSSPLGDNSNRPLTLPRLKSHVKTDQIPRGSDCDLEVQTSLHRDYVNRPLTLPRLKRHVKTDQIPSGSEILCDLPPKEIQSRDYVNNRPPVVPRLKRHIKPNLVPRGFDCEFVVEPPKEIQSKCPVCLQILKKPFQVSCCGYNFCQQCIDRILVNKKPCPICNSDSFTSFFNKGLQRSLNDFKVYCPHSENGCKWIGELGELLKHLNTEPDIDKQLAGCEHADVKCLYCQRILKRSLLTSHQSNECSKRPYICTYCGDYSSCFEDVTSNHWLVCPEFVISCLYKCSVRVARKDYNEHVRVCAQTEIDCEYKSFGCDYKVARKHVQNHSQNSMAQHLELVASGYSKLRGELETQNIVIKDLMDKVAAQQVSVCDLQKTQMDLKVSQESLLSVAVTLPIRLSVNNFTKIRENRGAWVSGPFYTHPQGYKMRLQVHPRPIPSGSSGFAMSVYFFLMKGEYDNTLMFPLDVSIAIRLLSVNKRVASSQRIVKFDERTPACSSYRVSSGDTVKEGWGYIVRFKDPSELKHYMFNDCLTFEIMNVQLH